MRPQWRFSPYSYKGKGPIQLIWIELFWALDKSFYPSSIFTYSEIVSVSPLSMKKAFFILLFSASKNK